jgi:DNA-binding Lrp family transcriptional regulator
VSEEKMMRLLHEMIKDSSKSDRQLAKVLNVSQPTISRMRKKIVAEDMIRGYSVIPNFYKMGYEIMVLTFIDTKHNYASKKIREEGFKKVQKWMMSKSNVIFCDFCRGMGMNGVMVSFHKSYKDFDEFMFDHNNELGPIMNDVQNVIINMAEHPIVKAFSFAYLANDK